MVTNKTVPVPLHGIPGYQPKDKTCRRCSRPLETPPHVLNACPNNMPSMNARHDAVLERLNRAIIKAGQWIPQQLLGRRPPAPRPPSHHPRTTHHH